MQPNSSYSSGFGCFNALTLPGAKMNLWENFFLSKKVSIKNNFFANNLYSQNLIFGQYLCMYTYFFINIQKSWPPYCPHIVHLILFLSVLKYIDIDIDEKHKTETFFSSTLVFLKLKYKLWHNLPEKIQFEIYNIWNVQYLILSCIY